MKTQIISIPEKEVRTIGKRASIVERDYNPQTVKECKELYRNASQIAEVAKAAIKDGLQGKALLEAKKLICGDEWDTPKFDPKWIAFLDRLGDGMTRQLKNRPNKQETSKVHYLLDFAGYKERGGEIEMASHYREAKKITGSSDAGAIDKAYSDAGGKELKTAKEVRMGIVNATKKVFVRDIFTEEVGDCPERGDTPSKMGIEIQKAMPATASWKAWYRKVSMLLHPDQGGDDNDQAILISLNEMMNIVISSNKRTDEAEQWEEDYDNWKEDRGYTNDFVLGDEL